MDKWINNRQSEINKNLHVTRIVKTLVFCLRPDCNTYAFSLVLLLLMQRGLEFLSRHRGGNVFIIAKVFRKIVIRFFYFSCIHVCCLQTHNSRAFEGFKGQRRIMKSRQENLFGAGGKSKKINAVYDAGIIFVHVYASLICRTPICYIPRSDVLCTYMIGPFAAL